MAKVKQAKKQAKASGAKKPRAKAALPAATASPTSQRAKVAKAARLAKSKAIDLAASPVVAEIVAATLVAAAAAIQDPQKARNMASAAGNELKALGKGAAKGEGALWQLAMDIARRSIDAIGQDTGAGKKRVAKGKGKKAKKAKKD